MNVWVFLCGWTVFRWMNCPFHQSTWMSEFFRWMNCPFHQSTWMSEFFRWMNCPFHQSTCMSIKSQMTAHVAIWQSKTRWINYSVHPPPFKKKKLTSWLLGSDTCLPLQTFKEMWTVLKYSHTAEPNQTLKEMWTVLKYSHTAEAQEWNLPKNSARAVLEHSATWSNRIWRHIKKQTIHIITSTSTTLRQLHWLLVHDHIPHKLLFVSVTLFHPWKQSSLSSFCLPPRFNLYDQWANLFLKFLGPRTVKHSDTARESPDVSSLSQWNALLQASGRWTVCLSGLPSTPIVALSLLPTCLHCVCVCVCTRACVQAKTVLSALLLRYTFSP